MTENFVLESINFFSVLENPSAYPISNPLPTHIFQAPRSEGCLGLLHNLVSSVIIPPPLIKNSISFNTSKAPEISDPILTIETKT